MWTNTVALQYRVENLGDMCVWLLPMGREGEKGSYWESKLEGGALESGPFAPLNLSTSRGVTEKVHYVCGGKSKWVKIWYFQLFQFSNVFCKISPIVVYCRPFLLLPPSASMKNQTSPLQMEPSMSSHQKDNISWSYVKHAHKTKRGDVEDVDNVVEDDDHDGFVDDEDWGRWRWFGQGQWCS